MSRTSRSQKSWTGVMIEDPRFVGSSLARWRASSSARFAKCRGDRDGASCGGDVVCADHRRALEDPDHHRTVECGELVEARDQLQIVRERLAEADPRIERHCLLRDAGGTGLVE